MKRNWFNLPFRVWTLEQNSGGPTEITSSDITDATNIGVSLLTSEDEASARNAIGAGTGNSNLTIGTTATTAKAGNYVPTWSEIADKPATFPPTIGTTATTAKAGNYQPTWAQVTGKPTTFAPEIGSTADTAAAGNHNHAVTAHVDSGLEAAANLQEAFIALSARVKALEDAVVE